MSWEIGVRMLGPLEVEVSGAPVRFDGAQQRTLFVCLALHAPEPVSADALLEALWGADQPSSAVHALQKQISRLRSRLGDAAPVNHRASGYAPEIDGQAIDSRRFEELLKRARLALGRDEPEQASADLREALALWRGAPLETMRQARELLVDQLGIEPGPELRRLEGMILRWDAR